jgi:hypothetical protein
LVAANSSSNASTVSTPMPIPGGRSAPSLSVALPQKPLQTGYEPCSKAYCDHPGREAGLDLQMTWFQQTGVPDEQFRSEVEWVRPDLLRLKTFLETPVD